MRANQKRGQVTIFIIVAILIVSVILVYFFYVGPLMTNSQDERLYVEKCIESELNRVIPELALTAGVLNSDFTTMYMDENITIVCYTDEYYKSCVVQQPFLKNIFEESLVKIMKPKIQKCYDNSVDELESKGYSVSGGQIKQSLEINPNGVSVVIDLGSTISNEDGSMLLSEVKIDYASNIYNILMIANSVLQFETSYGDSEVSSFMFFYPDLTVQKIRRDEGMKIYIISDKKDIQFKFASRSYAWPPGYGVSQ